MIYYCFFVFYLVWRMYKWSAPFKIYFMAFIKPKMNSIKPFIDVSNPIWYLERSDWKSMYNFPCFVNSHDFYVIIFKMHYSSSLSLKDIKLIPIVNYIFHVSDFFHISFVTLFRYGIILLTYFSIDSVLFLSLLPWYSIQLLFQKLPTLTDL